MPAINRHDSREAWLREATNALRTHFDTAGYPLPDRLRFAIALTSTGRNIESRPGETWHSSVSADETWEIIIRADKADPVEVLGILVHELVKTTLPIEAGHGKLYKKAAGAVGLQGPAKHAAPTPLLTRMLTDIAKNLGSLPHATLDIERGPRPVVKPIGARKAQKTYMRDAKCEAMTDNGAPCGYTVRIATKWANVGPPGCPLHGPMNVAPLKRDDEADEENGLIELQAEALKPLPENRDAGRAALAESA